MTTEAPEKLLLSAVETASLLGISRTSLYALHSSGRLPLPGHLGRRTLWRKQELIDWTNARLPNGELPSRQQWEAMKEMLNES